MTAIPWLLAIVALAAAGALYFLRSFSKRVRVAFDAACFAALSGILYRNGITPLFHDPIVLTDPSTLWVRGVALAWWLLGARVIVAILYFALDHERKSRETRLVFDLIAAAIYLVTGLLIIKSVLALPVGGVLATSGIVAIVLGLALQNTLADVFAGIAVGIEAPFQVGHRISLGKNIEGQVLDINWRSVRIQTDGADVAIVPNSIVAKSEIVNRSVPSSTRSDSVRLWCPSQADSNRVIDVLGQAILLCPAVLEDPAPAVLLTQMGPDCHGYTIQFSVAETRVLQSTKSLLLQHARKQLYYAGLLATGPKRRMQRLSVHQVLRQLVLFECLDLEQLEKLAQQIVTRLLEPGETLFSQGAADCRLYIVLSGVVEVSKTTESGRVITLGRLGAGEYLGEIGLLTGAPHAATARAVSLCSIHELSKEAIAPLFAARAELLVAFEKSVRHGLDLLQRSVAVGASETVRNRGELLNRIREFFRFRPTG